MISIFDLEVLRARLRELAELPRAIEALGVHVSEIGLRLGRVESMLAQRPEPTAVLSVLVLGYRDVTRVAEPEHLSVVPEPVCMAQTLKMVPGSHRVGQFDVYHPFPAATLWVVVIGPGRLKTLSVGGDLQHFGMLDSPACVVRMALIPGALLRFEVEADK